MKLGFAFALALAAALLGCPSQREGPGNGGDAGPPTPAMLPSSTVALPTEPVRADFEEPVAPALLPGVALQQDSEGSEGEAWGVELTMEVRPRFANGATARSIGVLRVLLADGRVRIRFGPHAFGLGDGTELRAVRWRAGAMLLVHGTPSTYRIVPPGALRPLLNERRIDVIPLAPSRVGTSEAITRQGRSGEAATVTTSYGVLRLEQIVAPVPPRSMGPAHNKPTTDAATEAKVTGVDGAGEPLCRAILELVAADRALGGRPCSPDHIPIAAEISFGQGGGLVFETTSIREGPIARVDLAFPPVDTKLASSPLAFEEPRTLLDTEALLGLHPKGDPSTLDLSSHAGQLRIALLDGVPVLCLAPGQARALTVRAGRYSLEWRTPLGEVFDRAFEIDAPGRFVSGQPSPPSLPSASPMASARTGP